MNYKITLSLVALFAFIGFVSVANAEIPKVVNVKVNTSIETSTKEKSTTTKEDQDEDGDDDNSTTSVKTHGEETSEDHRSAVSTFVHSLLNVANREGGIGAQVRVVAESQNDSGSSTAKAMKEIENRNSFKTFLVGTDYKNIGVIRAELATTTANIEHLKSLLNQTTSDSDRAEINLQIKALEADQVSIKAFVDSHENVFSLFGWLNKLFNK